MVLTLEEKYEQLKKEPVAKEAIDIPIAVREVYERELSLLRGKLQELQEGRAFGGDSLKEAEVRD